MGLGGAALAPLAAPPGGTEEMTANIKRMQQALGLEKLTSDEVRDYLRKMSGLVFGDGGSGRQCMSLQVTTQFV